MSFDYRSHGVTDITLFISGQKCGATCTIKRELKPKKAIEPRIGHMKNGGRLGRCYIKGQIGEAMNLVLVAYGHNPR